jgi:hypothetical protein
MSNTFTCPNGQLPLWVDDNAYVGENGYYCTKLVSSFCRWSTFCTSLLCYADPNTTVGDFLTYPQICPPSIECQQDRYAFDVCTYTHIEVLRLPDCRLATNFCPPQGYFEPTLCLPGAFLLASWLISFSQLMRSCFCRTLLPRLQDNDRVPSWHVLHKGQRCTRRLSCNGVLP